jgi:threonine/homoserine/homoserine lactone efflux protein
VDRFYHSKTGGIVLNEIVQICFHFLVLGISLAAPVGPIKLEMIKRGLRHGFWPSWLVGLGAATADLLYMMTIFFGLSPLLQIEFIRKGMLAIGISMLVFLGISTLRDAFQNKKIIIDEPGTTRASYWTGLSLAFLNPYNFVFWFGIYGAALQSIPIHLGKEVTFLISQFILLGIVLWNINVAFTAHFFRFLINEKIIQIIMIFAGIGLLCFACKLIVTAL